MKRQGKHIVAALSPEHFGDMLPAVLDHLSMAYERVTLPCSAMNCGDAIYRRCVACLRKDPPTLMRAAHA